MQAGGCVDSTRESSQATSGNARDLSRRFPIERRLKIAVRDEPLLTTDDMARHFRFDVVFEGAEWALVQWKFRSYSDLHPMLFINVRRHQVRFLGFERAPVAAESGS